MDVNELLFGIVVAIIIGMAIFLAAAALYLAYKVITHLFYDVPMVIAHGL